MKIKKIKKYAYEATNFYFDVGLSNSEKLQMEVQQTQ